MIAARKEEEQGRQKRRPEWEVTGSASLRAHQVDGPARSAQEDADRNADDGVAFFTDQQRYCHP